MGDKEEGNNNCKVRPGGHNFLLHHYLCGCAGLDQRPSLLRKRVLSGSEPSQQQVCLLSSPRSAAPRGVPPRIRRVTWVIQYILNYFYFIYIYKLCCVFFMYDSYISFKIIVVMYKWHINMTFRR